MTPAARTSADAAALRVARRIMGEPWPTHRYTRELALAGLLEFSATAAGAGMRPAAIGLARGACPLAAAWDREPFGSLTWALAAATGDQRLRDGFVLETHAMLRAAPLSAAGLLLHPRGAARGGGHAVLLDSGLEQVCRLARAHAVSGNPLFAGECLRQVRGHRDLLRDPADGLWRQGHGWLADPPRLSPGAWSRGHGWLLRGLVDGASALPAGSLRAALADLVREAADALLPLQDADGWWHALLHRPAHESPPETSGTAMIAAALARAVAHGLLPADHAEAAARRALHAVVLQVDGRGVVHGACPGPGPLTEEGPWHADAAPAGFPPDDEHGPLAVLSACAALADLDTDRPRAARDS